MANLDSIIEKSIQVSVQRSKAVTEGLLKSETETRDLDDRALKQNLDQAKTDLSNKIESYKSQLQSAILANTDYITAMGRASNFKATPLITKIVNSGTITLTQSYKKFDGLLFFLTDDSRNNGCCRFWPIKLFEFSMEFFKKLGKGLTVVDRSGIYWILNCSKCTETSFVNQMENSIMEQIYGITFLKTSQDSITVTK